MPVTFAPVSQDPLDRRRVNGTCPRITGKGIADTEVFHVGDAICETIRRVHSTSTMVESGPPRAGGGVQGGDRTLLVAAEPRCTESNGAGARRLRECTLRVAGVAP